MKIKFIVLFISLLVYSSCCTNEGILNVDINFSNISDGAFSDYFLLEQVIHLETNDSSVFDWDYADKYIFFDNKIYMGVDEGKDIKVFNAQESDNQRQMRQFVGAKTAFKKSHE